MQEWTRRYGLVQAVALSFALSFAAQLHTTAFNIAIPFSRYFPLHPVFPQLFREMKPLRLTMKIKLTMETALIFILRLKIYIAIYKYKYITIF